MFKKIIFTILLIALTACSSLYGSGNINGGTGGVSIGLGIGTGIQF